MINDKDFTITDKAGNRYVCDNGCIALYLKAEDRKRGIGRVYEHKSGMIIYEKNEEERHTFEKWDAWSLPVVIFEKVDGIHFISETTSYKITTAKANTYKDYLHFKTSGYELKVYIPKRFWHQKEL